MTTLSVWDPTRDFWSLRNTMDRLMNETMGQAFAGARPGTNFLPLDVYVNEDNVVVLASLPGLTADDVEIVYQGDTLTIRGEYKPPMGNVQWAMQERPYGKFSRTLTLNIPVDANKADASFENGLLTLTLPKAEWAKPRQISIKAQPKLEAGQPQPGHN